MSIDGGLGVVSLLAGSVTGLLPAARAEVADAWGIGGLDVLLGKYFAYTSSNAQSGDVQEAKESHSYHYISNYFIKVHCTPTITFGMPWAHLCTNIKQKTICTLY